MVFKIRISSILTSTTLAAAGDLLAKSSEVEVERVKADLGLMECVRRRVKQVAREEESCWILKVKSLTKENKWTVRKVRIFSEVKTTDI